VFLNRFLNQSLKYDLSSLAIPKNHFSGLLTLVTCDYSLPDVCKAVDGAGLIKRLICQQISGKKKAMLHPRHRPRAKYGRCKAAPIFFYG
jgi:hypothetical protein